MARRNSLTNPKYRQRETNHPTFHFRITFSADHHEITDVIAGILFEWDKLGIPDGKLTSSMVERVLREEFERCGYSSNNYQSISAWTENATANAFRSAAKTIGKELFPKMYENVK